MKFKTMKTILVPVDFSNTSFAAAHGAAALARKLNSRIFLLHVVGAPSDWNKMSVKAQQKFPDIESRIVDANIKIEQLSRGELFEGLEVTSQVRTGVAYESIIEFAARHKVDLIVIGAHGAGETDSLFVGSTAQRVIRLSPCAVISVKRDQDLSQIHHILFVSDFEENISQALNKTLALTALLNAKLELVYINTPAKFKDTVAAEKAMSLAMPQDIAIKTNAAIYNHYDRDSGILSYIERANPQLVAIVTHSRKSKPTYQISVTDTLLFHSEIPILSFVLK